MPYLDQLAIDNGLAENEVLAGGKRPSYSRLNWVIFFTAALLVFANFFSSLTIMPLYVLEIGGNEFQSGLHNTLFCLAAVVMRFYFGPFTDRFGRKLPLLIGAFVFASAPLLFMLATNLITLNLVRIYQAAGLATFFPGGGSLVADMAPPGRTGISLGGYRMTNTLGLLIGPPLGLLIIDLAGYNSWFIYSSVVGLFALVLSAFIKTPAFSVDGGFSSTGSLFSVLKNKKLQLLYFGIALASLSYSSILTFLVIYAGKVTALANPAVFFIYFSLGGLAAGLSAGYLSDRTGRPAVAWPCIALLGAGNLSLFFLPSLPAFFYISSILMGIGFSGGLIVLMAWLIDLADLKVRATAVSMQENTIDISMALGALSFGAAAGRIGLSASYLLAGLAVFLPALLLLIRQKGKRGLRL